MNGATQQERAEQFRQLHHQDTPLVLPNVWDAASARIIVRAGFPAIATTSSGLAAALGYPDGQQISRAMLVEALARITRVVECPVTADIEAGYGDGIDAACETLRAVLAAGVVGINIEDSLRQRNGELADMSYQTELIAALREVAASLAVPVVINARIDVFLHEIGAPESRVEQTLRRAAAYLAAGADCVYPIGWLDSATIAELARSIDGPINVMGGPPGPTLPELARLGVARVSLAGGLMRSVLGHLRAIARELREPGTYTVMSAEILSGAEFSALFAD